MRTDSGASSAKANGISYRRHLLPLLADRVVGNLGRKQALISKPTIRLKLIDSALASRLPKLEPLSPEYQASLKNVLRPARNWHGTGRYQYENGQIVDLLNEIAQQGKLLPHYDAADMNGSKAIISTARSRMYARTYADLHGKGANETGRYGSSRFWILLFDGDFFTQLLKDNWHTHAQRQHIRQHFAAAGGDQWYKKVRRQPTLLLDLFFVGSDIPGNYPIIFGIKDGAFKPIKISRPFALHEDRSSEPVALSHDITHLEVPGKYVDEVRQLLLRCGYNTSVLPIEDCERLYARLSVSQLMLGKLIN
jgi:hypothetical protein